MSEAPARIWGIVYAEPANRRDVLLDQRYTTEAAAVGVMRQIARQFIASQEKGLHLAINETAQHVLRVASQRTGQTFIRMRPIVAERWLASGQAPAPPEIDAYVRALLDDDDWM